MNHYRHAAVALALLAGTAAASAQTTVITSEPAQTRTVVTTQQPLCLRRPNARSFIGTSRVSAQRLALRAQWNTGSARAFREA